MNSIDHDWNSPVPAAKRDFFSKIPYLLKTYLFCRTDKEAECDGMSCPIIIFSIDTFSTAFSFQFSAKYTDAETGLLYYGMRLLNVSTGRWLSKDPIEEQGGANLYGFVKNCPIVFVDLFGLRSLSAQEQVMLQKLHQLSQDTQDKEFSKALEAVINDIKELINSVKSPEDPATLRIGLAALQVWADPNKAKIYNPVNKAAQCSHYVADVLAGAGINPNMIPRTFSFLSYSGYPSKGVSP